MPFTTEDVRRASLLLENHNDVPTVDTRSNTWGSHPFTVSAFGVHPAVSPRSDLADSSGLAPSRRAFRRWTTSGIRPCRRERSGSLSWIFGSVLDVFSWRVETTASTTGARRSNQPTGRQVAEGKTPATRTSNASVRMVKRPVRSGSWASLRTRRASASSFARLAMSLRIIPGSFSFSVGERRTLWFAYL